MPTDVTGDEEVPEAPPHPAHVSAALLLSFGPVHIGREKLAVETFQEVTRWLGQCVSDEVVTAFKPFFFADGQHAGMIGFFLIEGHREQLDELRRGEDFQRLLLRAGAATANVNVHTMIAGTAAGRLVHLYRDVRSELGLL